MSGLVDWSATPSEQDCCPHIKEPSVFVTPRLMTPPPPLSGKSGGETAKRRETRRRELQNEPGRGALRPVPGAPARAAPAAPPRHRPAPRASPRLPGGGEKGPGPRRERPSAPPALFLFASLPPLPPPSLPIWSGDTPDVGAARSPLPRTARPPGAADGAPRSPASPSLAGPPGLPPPRAAASSAATGRRAALLAAAARGGDAAA
ncbi:neuroblastoma suppressor of tumorigenicity 1 isoform X1 [Myotis daubentonii]|uniref:neuroblastoma suppressor of tumorigenicity 1 isoform X1 n=1 Tax=Myotis daubentonii TaxID=98922 RepID=UPI0028731B6B|nr:neuroblastoma suppressor of tumorigenicity 1 isoform X1 [Myotis daubentonii]